MWSWSYTDEGMAAIRGNIRCGKTPQWLRECYAEIQATTFDEDEDAIFHRDKYQAALEQAHELPLDILADAIYEFAETQATCDNGGHHAYCCPYGCHSTPPHHDHAWLGAQDEGDPA